MNKGTVYVVNVGDSRLYKVGSGIEQITEDHSLVEEMVRMGEISKEEARNHPEKNIITKGNRRVRDGGTGLLRHESSKRANAF